MIRKQQRKKPNLVVTHSINIIYQNINHDKTLKHLKLSLIISAMLHVVASIWLLGAQSDVDYEKSIEN